MNQDHIRLLAQNIQDKTETINQNTENNTLINKTENEDTESKIEETATKIEEPEPILKFLQKKSTSNQQKSNVPTILDMLSPDKDEEGDWGDDADIDTDNRSKTPSTDKLELPKSSKRSASDNSVVIESIKKETASNNQEESHKNNNNNSSNNSSVLNSIARALEDDDSFLDSSFEKNINYLNWKQTATIRAHFDCIRSMEFHKELPILLTASDDCTLKLWNITLGSKYVLIIYLVFSVLLIILK